MGTPWDLPENLNRVAPEGVSLVVTGCSQGPVGPLTLPGRNYRLKSVILPQHFEALFHKCIYLDVYRFLLARVQTCAFSNRFGLWSLQKFLGVLNSIKSWPWHLLSYHYVQYFMVCGGGEGREELEVYSSNPGRPRFSWQMASKILQSDI